MDMPPILLLQESNVLLVQIEEILNTLNLSWKEVDSLDSGYQYVQSHSPHLCVIDTWFENHQGTSFLQYIEEGNHNLESIVVSSQPSISDAVESIRMGASDYIERCDVSSKLPVILQRTLHGNGITNQHSPSPGQSKELIGKSAQFQSTLAIASKAAESAENVLIQGESGTGKELFARYIHYHGNRSNAAFIPVNCGAIPDSLLESELFGHVKGAFTGADAEQAGFFQAANGGTLFLDEIANTSQSMQAKLLRVLESNEIWKIGSRRPDKTDVRIIAATNEDLYALVQQGQFREDLFYRLNVISFTLPPLRERSRDILPLLQHFVQKFALKRNEEPKHISNQVIEILKAYDWPGNVRELENMVKRLIILSDNERIMKSDLPQSILSDRYSIQSTSLSLEDMEKDHIKHVCELHEWNISKAARQLQIGRRTLYDKLEKYKLR